MPAESHALVQLPGSERAPLPDATPAGELDTSRRAELTLVLRRRAELPAEINGAYTAGPGWDACSGLGSPDGTALLARLEG